jgi:hypothetical protein
MSEQRYGDGGREILEAYQAVSLPALEEYEGVLGSAREAYGEAMDQAPDQEARNRALEVYRETRDRAWGVDRPIERSTWEVVAESLNSSPDPLLRFLGSKVGRHYSPIVETLAILPATIEEIDALADELEWCEAYDDARDEFLATLKEEK